MRGSAHIYLDWVSKKEHFVMRSGTKVILGIVGAALLLLALLSAFASGAAWFPQDGQGVGRSPGWDSGMGQGMGSPPMMGGSSRGTFEKNEPFDRQFIDRMIPHHAMATLSAQHMISDSRRPELRDLAENIVDSQTEQIEQMRTWREEWYGDPGPEYPYQEDGRWGDGMGWDDNGMMDGDAADAMFLRMMIPHHQQAIQMSRVALQRAEHPETRQLAEQIIAEQSAEIKAMRGYLQEID